MNSTHALRHAYCKAGQRVPPERTPIEVILHNQETPVIVIRDGRFWKRGIEAGDRRECVINFIGKNDMWRLLVCTKSDDDDYSSDDDEDKVPQAFRVLFSEQTWDAWQRPERRFFSLNHLERALDDKEK